jgi:hypothetical protein
MEDTGYSVIRFGLLDSWNRIFQKYSSLFGSGGNQ